MHSKPAPHKKGKTQKKDHMSFLFEYRTGKEGKVFLIKENLDPKIKDDDFLVLGREEFCLEYSTGEVSRMYPEAVQEKSLKY